MAALWRKSQEIIRDANDARAVGAKAYFYAAGTTTPLTVYSDNAQTTPRTQPVEADAAGRMPSVFLAIGVSYKERVTTSAGTLLWEVDNVDPAPFQPAAGGGSVEAVDLLDVGDVIWRPATGTRSGWVRLNGNTIGNGPSNATERANSDAEDLFTLLWNQDAASPNNVLTIRDSDGSTVSKGASAAADWAANRTIALPDLRGRTLWGLDTMGASDASRLSGISATFPGGQGRSTLFSATGASSFTIAQANLPNVNLSSASLTVNVVPSTTPVVYGSTFSAGAGATSVPTSGSAVNVNFSSSTVGGTVPLGGSGTALPVMPPFLLGTFYCKLSRETS
jgi:hypothetical protein